jgi:hypothetical protein
MGAAFAAAGADFHVGARMPTLFAEAGIGAPDGTDVAGRLVPLAEARWMIAGVHAGTLQTALAHGATTEEEAAAWRAQFAADVRRFPDRPTHWPLMIGTYKRRR